MKYRLILTMALLSLSHSLLADASATWTCTGKKIVLKSQTPYMGENSPHTQTLFTLSKRSMAPNDSIDTAFFLNVEQDVGKFGMLYLSGSNEVGGTFEVVMSAPKDIGDGSIIRLSAQGTISYQQGPTLSGMNEKVDCLFE